MRTNSPTISKGLKAVTRLSTPQKRCAKGGATKDRGARRSPPIALLSEHFEVAERPVRFNYYNAVAKEVLLAGAFNDWKPALPMNREATDLWVAELTLKPGTYEYRFIVDGVWQEDPMSERFIANPFGGLNSVVIVKS